MGVLAGHHFFACHSSRASVCVCRSRIEGVLSVRRTAGDAGLRTSHWASAASWSRANGSPCAADVTWVPLPW
eukprot:13851258-Alexandrium_andersonii.AAC.1